LPECADSGEEIVTAKWSCMTCGKRLGSEKRARVHYLALGHKVMPRYEKPKSKGGVVQRKTKRTTDIILVGIGIEGWRWPHYVRGKFESRG